MDELEEKVDVHGEFRREGSALCRSYIGSGEGITPWREPGRGK